MRDERGDRIVRSTHSQRPDVDRSRSPRSGLAAALVLAVVVGVLGFAPSAWAASITVTTTADEYDTAGSGAGCSLREAITSANNDAQFGGCAAGSGADVINFAVNGTFAITRNPGPDENSNVSGDFDLLSNVTISGNGAGVTIIDGLSADRVLDAAPLGGAAITVGLSGVTIRNGKAFSDNFNVGGGMYISGSVTATIANSIIANNQSVASSGGAIENRGSLSLNSVTMQGNSAFALGGAINNIGALTVSNSSFTSNSAESGGALFINTDAAKSVTVDSSTFSSNSTTLRAGGIGDDGGAIAANTDGAVTISRSTFTSNSAVGNGGAIYFGDSATQAAVGSLGLSFNRIVGNTAAGPGSGLYRASGTVTAENNWWGCNAGPGSAGCQTTSGTVDSNPWLQLSHTATPATIASGETSTLTASMATNSAGSAIAAADLVALVGLGVSFSNASGGTLSNAGTALSANGTATATFTAGSQPGPASAAATIDGQGATASLQVEGDFGPTVTTQPADQTVDKGDNATFTAAADGSPAPTVQWQVSTDGGGTWGNLAGATSTTLNVATTQDDNGNKYRAVFTNSLGTATSDAATLTVLYQDVTISREVSAATVPAGDPVGYTITISSTGTLESPPVHLLSSLPTRPGMSWTVNEPAGVMCTLTPGVSETAVDCSTPPIPAGESINLPFTSPTTTESCGTLTYIPGVTTEITCPKLAQTITFSLPSSATYGDAPITLTGSASSGLPVTYSVAPDEDACSVSGTRLTILHAGTCTVTAAQAGNDEYDAAASVADELRIRQLFVSLFLRAPSQLMYAESARLEVTALHGNTPTSVTYSTTTPALCEVFNGRVGGVKALAASGTCEVRVEAENTRDIAYGSDTATITLIKANQTISFGALPDLTFGEPDFTVSATATSSLPVSFSASGDCTVSGNQVHLTGAGTCTITASQAGDDNYNAATDVSQSFEIAPDITLNDPTPQPVQYSDELTVSADVKGGLAGSVAFDVDGSPFCTADVVAGTAECSDEVILPAGTYDLDATFAPTDTTRTGGTASGSVTVSTEDAEVAYTGPLFVSTGSATATSTSVTLNGRVTEAADGDLGDLSKAKVTFYLFRSTNVGGVANLTVNGTVATDGTVTATIPNLGVDNWVVIPRFNTSAPAYFDGSDGDAMVLTVYAPTTGIWATGGGWVTDPGTNNIPVAIDPTNTHGNFGFNVRYKSGTTPSGQSVFVFHGANGYDYVVKSNSWKGGGAAFTTTGASFSGKAAVTVFNPATSTVVSGLGGGNFTYRVDVRDGATDSYAISVYDSRGKLYHQAGTTSVPLPLKGGNITVHAK